MPWIAPIQNVTAALAGRQVAKYSSSVPTGNGMKWGSESGKKLNLNGTGSPYGPQPDNGPLKPLRPYGPQHIVEPCNHCQHLIIYHRDKFLI